MSRQSRSGRFSRVLATGAFIAIAGSLLANHLFRAIPENELGPGLAMLGVALVVLIRSLWLGVYVKASGLRIVTWTRRHSFDWIELHRADAVPYDGLLTRGETSLLSMIRLTLADGQLQYVYGTVGRPASIHRQATQLNAAIRDRTE